MAATTKIHLECTGPGVCVCVCVCVCGWVVVVVFVVGCVGGCRRLRLHVCVCACVCGPWVGEPTIISLSEKSQLERSIHASHKPWYIAIQTQNIDIATAKLTKNQISQRVLAFFSCDAVKLVLGLGSGFGCRVRIRVRIRVRSPVVS